LLALFASRREALELALRAQCQRLRVVERLSGAHFLFPSGEISLAVRAYFVEDCQKLTTTAKSDGNDSDSRDLMQNLVEWHQGVGLTEDIDGLSAFRNSFKYSLVVMVLDGGEQLRQLSQADSFFHRVQVIMSGSCGEQDLDIQVRMHSDCVKNGYFHLPHGSSKTHKGKNGQSSHRPECRFCHVGCVVCCGNSQAGQEE
jgi:hypothetical protein